MYIYMDGLGPATAEAAPEQRGAAKNSPQSSPEQPVEQQIEAQNLYFLFIWPTTDPEPIRRR